MIKTRFLKPFEDNPKVKADVFVFTQGISLSVIVSFLKTASDDELQKMGRAIFYLFPSNIRKQLANNRKDTIDYSFIDDYIKTYHLHSVTTPKDKAIGSALISLLRDNPEMNATEFCENIKR